MIATRMDASHNSNTGPLMALTRVTAGLIFLTSAGLTLKPVYALDAPAKPRPAFTAPLPPVRPTGLAGIPAPAQSPPAPASSSTPIEAPALELPAQPRTLPAASRTRMHECGLEWQKMKESGAAADKVWFDFAQVCLAK